MSQETIPFTDTLEFQSQEEIRILFGCQDQYLRFIRERLGIQIVVRGEELRLSGAPEDVETAVLIFSELRSFIAKYGELLPSDVSRVVHRHCDQPAGQGLEATASQAGNGQTDRPSDAGPADPTAPGPAASAAAVAGSQSPDAVDPPPGSGTVSEAANRSSELESPVPRTVTEPGPRETGRGSPARSARNPEPNLGSIDLFEKARRVKPRTPGQARYIEAIRESDLVFCTGPAGCGKTYLAVAMALNALRKELVRKIVLVRPAVEAGEKLGFLPGDLLAKVNPYLRPLLDALADILSFEQVKRYMENDVIEIVPLAYMRGRTLNDTFIILDEAQNTTATQMKMFLTRMGEYSKIVVTGDPTQVDLPSHVRSGLTDASRRLAAISGVEAVDLSGQDIVRHQLVREIVRAYDTGLPSPASDSKGRKKS